MIDLEKQLRDLQNEFLLHLYSTKKRRALISYFADDSNSFSELLEMYDKTCAKVSSQDAKRTQTAHWQNTTYEITDSTYAQPTIKTQKI